MSNSSHLAGKWPPKEEALKAMNSTIEVPTVDAPSAPPVPTCILCKVPLCEVCGSCETDECRMFGKAATSKSDLIALKHLLAETQKVRGYIALATTGLDVPTPYRIISDVEDIESAVQSMLMAGKTTIFVRPCPKRPRHGFVESRKVDISGKNLKGVQKVFTEARAVDTQAELLLCPLVLASHNVVLTPTRMAVAVGHDGATAGKASLSIPLVGKMFHEISDTVLKQAGLRIESEDPYIESVITAGAHTRYGHHDTGMLQVQFTQIRAGVKIPPRVGDDYIPEAVKVLKVIEASGDLLEWEKQTQQLTKGTVVVHIGGTLISHYGVHCMTFGVPCLTSRVPKVGEDLVPTAKIDKPEPRDVVEGLAVGTLVPIHHQEGYDADMLSTSQASVVVMTVLHNAAAMGGRDGFWIGVGTTLMMRLGMAACFGEARHADSNRKNLGREYIYRIALKDFFGSRKNLGWALERFQNYKWASGYGGKKWADCTQSVLRMDEAARVLMKEPSNDAVAEVISALNVAVNKAHNGGWWLNKFVLQQAFADAAVQSMKTLTVAAPAMLTIGSRTRVGAAEIVKQWCEAEPIKTEAVPVTASTESDEDAPNDDPIVYSDKLCGDSSCKGCYPDGA